MLKTQEIISVDYQSQLNHFYSTSITIGQKDFPLLQKFVPEQYKSQILIDSKDFTKVVNQNKNQLISLERLFPFQNISFNQPKIDYLNSFIPKIEILFKHKSIIFKVTKTEIPHCSQVLPHQNSVNSHLFKPKYRQNKQFLECFVPTEEIMIKTMVGLYQIFEFHKAPQPLVHYIKNDDLKIQNLISLWVFENQVLFCRIESLITFLLIRWLHQKQINHDKIKSLIIELESARLKIQKMPFKELIENLLQAQGLSKTQFFEYFQIKEQRSQSIFFYGANFTFNGKRISAVMLPWGLQLANQLINAIYSLRPDIKRIAIIGGVGFTGKKECNIDDIFIPNSCIFGQTDNFQKVQINNGIKGNSNTEFFTQHNIIEGCIRSVFPELGKLSQIVGLQKVLDEIDAIEMQFEAIYRRSVIGKSQFGAIFYVMDNVYKNIHLGSTYYNRDFLEGLFKKFERGKHFCYEKALKYLTKQ